MTTTRNFPQTHRFNTVDFGSVPGSETATKEVCRHGVDFNEVTGREVTVQTPDGGFREVFTVTPPFGPTFTVSVVFVPEQGRFFVS